MKKITIFCCLSLAFLFGVSQDQQLYERKEFIRNGDTLRYRILYPEKLNPKKKYPVILLLHGAGERGNDNQAQLTHGWKLFADSINRKKYPAIVIFPQCPKAGYWANVNVDRTKSPYTLLFSSVEPMTRPMQMVSALMDSIAGLRITDKKRVYVGGLSMGGMGTFDLLWRKPGFFAAAFPICGGGDTAKAKVYGKKFPIWVFHGEKDAAVDVRHSREMVSALQKAGAKLKYSEYPNVNHDSWNNAFAEPGLLPWLFQNKSRRGN